MLARSDLLHDLERDTQCLQKGSFLDGRKQLATHNDCRSSKTHQESKSSECGKHTQIGVLNAGVFGHPVCCTGQAQTKRLARIGQRCTNFRLGCALSFNQEHPVTRALWKQAYKCGLIHNHRTLKDGSLQHPHNPATNRLPLVSQKRQRLTDGRLQRPHNRIFICDHWNLAAR